MKKLYDFKRERVVLQKNSNSKRTSTWKELFGDRSLKTAIF